jgi:hypothetical protein
MVGWGRVKCVINDKYGKEDWFGEIVSYLLQRYSSIEDRILETFRFVACNSGNRHAFSYEYASILRDAGSVFGSVMDRLIRKTEMVSGQLDIRNYRKWLMELDIPEHRDRIRKIYSVSVDINYPLQEKVLLPFRQFSDDKKRLDWWEAYNDVKHSDIDKFHAGNFENALNSVAALSILLALSMCGREGRLLVNPGLYEPEEYLQSLLFFKPVANL